mmetsp:Transcript_73293/g.145809  ORF Transcript_73293/g.145809 Transcript_73293/m.145809 type:complete len:259 (-) Transcript_73293:15-791(-)
MGARFSTRRGPREEDASITVDTKKSPPTNKRPSEKVSATRATWSKQHMFALAVALTVPCVGGATCFLFVRLESLRQRATCVVNEAIELHSLDAVPAGMAVALPSGMLDVLRPHAPYFDLYVVAVALVLCLSILAAAFAVWRTQRRWRCAKFLIGLSIAQLVVFLAANATLFILALMARRPVIMDPWSSWTSFCVDDQPALAAAATNLTLIHFDALCTCLSDDALSSLSQQAAPAGVETFILAAGLIALVGACCIGGGC